MIREVKTIIKHQAVSIRMTREIFEELEKARADQTRTRSGQIVHYIIKGLLRDGYLLARLS